MKKEQAAQPFDGLTEEMTIELAKDRIIRQPVLTKTTLATLYDNFDDPYEPHSYAGLSSITQIGFAELHGQRKAMEDRIAFGTQPAFLQLSENQRCTALFNTIAKLEQVMDSHYLERTGSTLCAAVICGKDIYTASVGDSAAYLVALTNEDEAGQCRRLNVHLHHPHEPSEEKRLEKAGKAMFSRHHRLMGLAVSRAMGDTMMEEFGLIHDPDIYHDEINLPQKGKAFLIVACDGLTEGDCLTANPQPESTSIFELVQKNSRCDPQKMASVLAHEAIKKGSSDNVSVIVTLLDHTQVSVKYMAVFDGHGGTACAELLRKHFHTLFSNTIQQILDSSSSAILS